MNQPPPTSQPTQQQTGKRIVSKGAYAQGQAIRLSLSLTAAFILLGVLIPTLFLAYSFFSLGKSVAWPYLLLSLPCAYIGIRGAIKQIQAAKGIEPGVPLTRANTADLPAPDTLVRASAEPVQEQQAILLRAATASGEQQEDQLLRASAGK